MREYVSRGAVFGVDWEGQFPPDLQQLLGPYCGEQAAAQRQRQAVDHLRRNAWPGGPANRTSRQLSWPGLHSRSTRKARRPATSIRETSRMCRFRLLLAVGSVLWLAACGSSNNATTVTGVTAICLPSPIQSSQLIQCAATVTGTGTFTTNVTWTASAGSINGVGTFTAPVVSRTYVGHHNGNFDGDHVGVRNSDGDHRSGEPAAAHR